MPNNLNENTLLNYEKFYLIKENSNIIYKIIVGKTSNDEILLKYKNYKIQFNKIEFSILTKNNFSTIDEAYNFLISNFENDKVIIKEIITKKSFKLLLKLLNNNKEHNVELLLEYCNNSKNLLDIFKLNNEINILKNEIILLKNEINKLKNKEDSDISEENEDDNDSSNNSKTENKDNINNIDILCDIVNDSYSDLSLSDTFTVFKSINDILYLIYSNKNSSIIFYNIVDNKKIKEIEKAHDKYITNFRHFLDDINKRDLILSISDDDNIIKIWTIYGNNTIDFLLEIKANQVGYLYSACILKENNNLYIISSNSCSGDSEKIKVI